MIAKSLITQNSILCMHKCVISRATYLLKYASVESVASGERKKIYDCYRPNDLLSHKFNSVYAQMCSFKSNLQAENAPVQSVARGEMRKNMIAKSLIKQNSILCMHAQMCQFKGNLPTENAPVQSVVRGEMRKNMIAKSLITQNSILCMHKCVISWATYILKMHQFKV